MKTGPNSRKPRSAAEHNGNGTRQASDRAAHPAPGSALVQFAADRAHDAADALYAKAKDRIDRTHRAVGDVRIDTAWEQVQPALIGALGFVRHYPMRAAMILGLLGGAYWLTRVDERAAP
ncbi:MAG: hypothetical protein K0Q76_3190 [Panacagrimonas sp.]|jgi:hypothetical protein|nr:hypothetical protein [Panacagrimonas sp.]MCC2658082.1 hypothetical protein [Panacagrimonas sp.]